VRRERWYRSRLLHLAVGLLVAVLTASFAGERARQGVLDNLDARLRDAGAGADAALVDLEAEQLSALRSIEFTRGVPQALEQTDPNELNRLVTPLQANSGVPMVDIVQPSGRVVFAVRSKGAPRPVASRAGMPAIAQAMRRASGARGGRFSELVVFKSGPTFVTVGPLMIQNDPVGVVLVMTPLADALGRLSQEVRTTLTAYTAGGTPIATTGVRDPARIAPQTARSLLGGGAIEYRFTAGGTREALGRLIIDHQASAVLGVSLHDNSPVTRRDVIVYTAIGLLATVILMASLWARVHQRRTA
jgi:hypothetical protein